MKGFVLKIVKTPSSWTTFEWHIQKEEMIYLEKLETEQKKIHYTCIII
jgi:hypothetical protein